MWGQGPKKRTDKLPSLREYVAVSERCLEEYLRTQDSSLLDLAIRTLRNGLPEAPTTPGFAQASFLLGQFLRTRWSSTGSMTDLEWGLRRMRDGLEATAPDDLALPLRLQQLADTLLSAVELFQPGEARTLAGSHLDYVDELLDRHELVAGPDQAALRLSTRGLGHLLRTTHTGDLDPAIQAIGEFEQAARLAPTRLDAARYGGNLAKAWVAVHAFTGSQPALVEARNALVQAVDQAPAGSVEHAILQRQLHLTESGLGNPSASRVSQEHDLPPLLRLRWAVAAGEEAERAGSWEQAADSFLSAVHIIERIHGAQATRLFADRVLGEQPVLTSQAAYALACAGRPFEALATVERGRARALAESAADLDLTPLHEAGRADLAAELQQALKAVEAMEGQVARTEYFAMDGNQEALLRGRKRLAALWSKVGAIDGCADLQPATILTEDFLRQHPPSAPVVVLVGGTTGGAALIRSDSQQDVEFVNLPDAPNAEVQRHAAEVAAAIETLFDDSDAALDRVDEVCRWMWDAVWEPVSNALVAVAATRATVLPCGWFGLLPMHAAWTSDPQRVSGRRYAVDDPSFSYLVNLRYAVGRRRRAPTMLGASVVVVADPQPTSNPPLPDSRAEAMAIKECWPDAALYVGPDARLPDLLSRFVDATVVHLETHGTFDAGEPRRSSLLFAQDERWSVDDLSSFRFTAAPLVTLSACETATLGRTAPDEVVSLFSAFLRAGASEVLAAMWPVADDSTALLVQRLYQELSGPGAPDVPEGLRRAQVSVRDFVDPMSGERPYEHPLFWAGFQHFGTGTSEG